MAAPDSMHAYYSDRAPSMPRKLETDPRGWVQEILVELQQQTKDRTVLEIACGTGNWTRVIAPGARSVTATDFSEAMLQQAKALALPNVRFLHDDAYRLSTVGDERFDTGFAMHWASHIALARWDEFFTAFHARLKPGAKVFLVDDIRRPDDTDPWYSRPATRDTYEARHLPNGETYEIVKTYFTADQLRSLVQPYANNLQLRYERPCWRVTYEVRDGSMS